VKYQDAIYIGEREISLSGQTYFIADIGASHDGELSRAKDLIWLAKESGADAVKFQHFKASQIVSDFGFKNLGGQKSHQAKWKKSVYEIYAQYECNRDWNQELIKAAQEAGVDFMTTPYDLEAVELFDPYVPAYKIGSGDITWLDFIKIVSQRSKPILLATGASSLLDVERAVETVLAYNSQLALLQCNTNYTGSPENFGFINLRVLQSYASKYPGMPLGLSDHTPGHATVLGAIALGARIIEKHFTDDNKREGPDHPFSMTPLTWREMINRSRELEMALGTGTKRVESNESDTVIVQRRCLRLTRNMEAGEKISSEDLEALRPAPTGALEPYRISQVLGQTLAASKTAGDAIYEEDFLGDICLEGI
jgi:N-acetylneuraminate synthase